VVSIATIEAADGAGYTAAFSERLVGDDRKVAAPNNYAVVSQASDVPGCQPPDSADWRGDAGATWLRNGWPYTLYNHTLRPNQSPSCMAADAQSAAMGASSAHVEKVNVLLLDGSARSYTSNIDEKIWKALAATNDCPAAANP
jgi:hypothetical protein